MSMTLRELNLSATRGSACLALAMLAGCGGDKSTGTVTTDTNTPVNTGLANIADRPGLSLPTEEELMQTRGA